MPNNALAVSRRFAINQQEVHMQILDRMRLRDWVTIILLDPVQVEPRSQHTSIHCETQ